MEVSFDKGKLQKICNNDKKLRGEYGPRMAEAIKERLAELVAAEVLGDMRTIPRALSRVDGKSQGIIGRGPHPSEATCLSTGR